MISGVIVTNLVITLIVRKVNGIRYGFVPPPPQSEYLDIECDTRLFLQIVDHSKHNKSLLFFQKYFQSTRYCENIKNCNIFLMVGGEGEISPAWMDYGAWSLLAGKYSAVQFALEHRYYGESRPVEDLSVDNLKYLSSEQALGDIASFIDGINTKYNLTKENKWILFGGSYAGSLVAWARLKYPHLVHGAVSSSAPLKAQLDFKEYFQVVRDVLDKYNKDCSKLVHDVFMLIQSMLETDRGKREIVKMFNFCKHFDRRNSDDVSLLLLALASPILSCVQYDKTLCDVRDICQTMTNSSISDPMDRLLRLSEGLRSGDNSCININFNDTIREYSQTSWNSSVAAGDRQWIYQTCTEFGYYVTSSNKEDLFGPGIPLSLFLNHCKYIFGERFNKNNIQSDIARTNLIYGSLDLQTSRVLFTHGSYDPWHALGLTRTPYPEAPVIYIKGTSHCADLYLPRSNDPPQLTAARVQTDHLIRKWLVQKEGGLLSPLTSFPPNPNNLFSSKLTQ